MMMPPKVLSRLGVKASGVLHVGAHEAEEGDMYSRAGWGPVTWVEMLPDKAALLRARFRGDADNQVIEAACWSSETTLTLHRAKNGQSSSVLEPKEHLVKHPHVEFLEVTQTVHTKRLDQVLPPDATFDFINIDTQGSELEIVKGMGTHLKHVQWAYLEVNEIEHYAGCALLPEVDAYLEQNGFTRIIRLKADDAGWGDALYARLSALTPLLRSRLRMSARLFHAWKAFRRPQHTPPWDNG